MAKVWNYLSLVAILLATIVARISASDQELETPIQCAKHMGTYCGKQAYDTLFYNKNSTMPMDCCYKLVQTGYVCHIKLTVHVLQNNLELKDANWTTVLNKGDKMYNKCNQATISGDRKYLEKCAKDIGDDCGEEVYMNLVREKNISKQCCEKLVKIGQNCHTSMVKALIRTPELRDSNAIEFLNKSEKLFSQCQHVK